MEIRHSILAVALSALAPAVAFGDQESERARQRFFDDQLVLDMVEVPADQGALFVPAMTESQLEPQIRVWSGDREVANGWTSSRLVVPPGTYRVTIGRDPNLATEVTVRRGQTTLVQPWYVILQLSAADDRGLLLDRDFVVTTLDGKSVATGRTSKRAARRSLSYALAAGRYRVVLDDDPESATMAVVVPLPPGEVLRYRFVVEQNRVLRTEIADTAPIFKRTPWQARWRIGADLAFNASENTVAAFNGKAAQVGGFTDMSVRYDRSVNLIRLDLRAHEAWVGISGDAGSQFPFQKLVDIAEADLTYDIRLWRTIGPYIRGSARTSLFPTKLFGDGAQVFVIPDASGRTTERNVNDGDEVELMGSLEPLVFQEGAGLGLTIVDVGWLSIIGRGGAALRQSFYDGGLYVKERTGARISFGRLEDYSGWGLEAAAVASLRIDDAVWIDSLFEGYVDQKQVFAGAEFEPVFRWRNTATVSFNDSVSLAYHFTIARQEFGVDALSMSHLVSLRAHATIF